MAAVTVGLPLGFTAFWGELPSLLGFLIVGSIALMGTLVGIVAGGMLIRGRRLLVRSR